MKEFVTAAKSTLGEVDEDDVITFKHDGREVTFFVPSTGQQAIMLSMGGRDMDPKAAGTFIHLFFEMMDHDTQRYFNTRLLDREDTFDLDTEGGVFDIFEHITEQWSGKATRKPSDYLAPQRKTGGASKAPTRVRASRSSASRSTPS